MEIGEGEIMKRFVTFEGIDGSGKSTVSDLLVKKLNSMNLKAIMTSEPTSSEIGVILRKYLSDPHSIPSSDALLFAADRVEHYFHFIKPHVDDGYIVICDRYKFSSIVYQGSQNVDKEWIRNINKMAGDPDIIFYLELDIESSLNRLHGSNRDNLEKFENKTYLRRIITGYEDLIDDSVIRINAENPIEDVVDLITKKLLELIKN